MKINICGLFSPSKCTQLPRKEEKKKKTGRKLDIFSKKIYKRSVYIYLCSPSCPGVLQGWGVREGQLARHV